MNEELTNVSGAEMSDADTDYVAAIQELQNNTVSKAQYEKLRTEHKKLLNALVNGQKIEAQPAKKPEYDLEALRKKQAKMNHRTSMLDYWKNSLAIHEAELASGEPMKYFSNDISAEENMAIEAKVFDVIADCIDRADGSEARFKAELEQRINFNTPTSR